MNDIVTLDTNANYAAMAKAMGIASEGGKTEKKSNNLARLRIHHTPLMGQAEVKGKMVNMEVVSGGMYKAGNTRWTYILLTQSYYPSIRSTLYV
jgi:hypothetical protein